MHKNRFFSVLVPLISVLLAFLVGCIIMAALKANPGTALKALWKGAFGSTRSLIGEGFFCSILCSLSSL